jgi:hypothetical protein
LAVVRVRVLGARRTGSDKGPSKKSRRTLTWLVGSSNAQKVRAGQILLSFFVVFLNSPHRETPKNGKKQIEKNTVLDSPPDFFNFSIPYFCKTFFVVFLNSHR